MLNLLYQLLLTANATSLLIVVFLIKEQKQITCLASFPNGLSYVIFICVPIILTGISLLLTCFLSDDSVEGDIKAVEQANNAFLPSYLGYFFVALSIPKFDTLIFVFIILFMFTFFSQTLYFNPLFLLWGYQFYYITTENNVKLFIISRKMIRASNGLVLDKLKRINNFTYIDIGGK